VPCIREDFLFDVILDKHIAPFAIITLQRRNNKIRKNIFISCITKFPEGRLIFLKKLKDINNKKYGFLEKQMLQLVNDIFLISNYLRFL